MQDNLGSDVSQPDLSDLEQVDPQPAHASRFAYRATVLAGLTLGITAAVLVGQDISTVVSYT
jgi:hypothetical protein